MTLLIALLFGCPVVTENDQASIRDSDGDGFDAIGFGGLDCDDTDPEVHPLADEVWYDSIDDDCDGNTHDQDEDGILGGPEGPDCDDTDPSLDDTLYDRFLDADGDGYGTVAAEVCPHVDGYADAGEDCDDTDPAVHPGATEVWYDAVDDDCDGNLDDRDGDGFPGGDVGSDCDDRDPDVLDNLVFYVDGDGDGFGDPDRPVDDIGCLPGSGEVDNDEDCNDLNPDIHPEASEVCDEYNVDEDCDGLGDDLDNQGPSPGNQSYFYEDYDRDGYGSGPGELRCDITDGLSAVDGDCDDMDITEFPGAIRYLDRDRDTFGNDDDAVVSCERILGRTLIGGDCNDRDNTVYPGAPHELPYDFIDTDCDGGTDVERTPNGYPQPVGAWDPLPEWIHGATTCGGMPTQRHVGSGYIYPDIQSAIDASAPCDIVVVHAGSYAPFTVDKRSLVVTAEPEEEVTIWGGSQVHVTAADVTLADLTISSTTSGLRLDQSAFLDRVTLVDNLANITYSGDLWAYELEITSGVGGITRPIEDLSGNLRIVNGTFSDILGLLGVLNSGIASKVELTDVAMSDSTGGVSPAINIIADELDINGLAVVDGAGTALHVLAANPTFQNVILRNNVVFDAPIFDVDSLFGDRVVVHDLRASENTWFVTDDATEAGFITVDGFQRTFLDDIAMAANVLDDTGADPAVQPVWLRSIDGSIPVTGIRAIHHVVITGYDAYGEGRPTGVGVQMDGGDLRQATLVGLDAALWSMVGGAPLQVEGSILWDNEELYLAEGLEPALDDCASNHDAATACDDQDPRFLRYHENLDPFDWDLRLFRDSPYYQVEGGPTVPTCPFDDTPPTGSPGETQYGAYGDYSLVPAVDFLLADGVLVAADLLSDDYLYADCNTDLVYDSWAAQFQALDPDADPDNDHVSNFHEFQGSTIPQLADTDGDGADDAGDDDPLDPTVQ